MIPRPKPLQKKTKTNKKKNVHLSLIVRHTTTTLVIGFYLKKNTTTEMMMLIQSAENDMNTTEDVLAPSSQAYPHQLFTQNNNFQNNANTNNDEDRFISSLRTWNTDSTNTGSLTEDPFTSMQGSSSNILVTVRVRPESAREKAERKTSSIVRVIDRNVLVFDPSDSAQGSQQQRRALGLRRGKELRFAFDRVFDETATQLEVYENSAKALLESVLDGYNATVFAYGATGAGKTVSIGIDRLNNNS